MSRTVVWHQLNAQTRNAICWLISEKLFIMRVQFASKGKSSVTDNCVKIQLEMEGMKKQMEAMDKDIKVMMVQIFEKLRFLENTIQISSAVSHASNAFMADILIAGGWD